MKKTSIFVTLLAGFLLCGCQALEKKQQVGAAVEVSGHYLYRSTLDSLTVGLNSEDSLRVVQQYIAQWAKDVLVYEEVQRKKSTIESSQIERMVSDYRSTLYRQAYEDYLVERQMPKGVADSAVAQIYARMPERFRLDESIVKGLLVIVPSDALKIDKLRGWMSKQEMDNIEKYAYQNAKGYELFDDKWLTTTDLMAHMPISRNDLETNLKTKNQIEVKDSTKTYILQVTDKHMRGEQMPIDYARPQIEKILLNARQVEFLEKERERLYNEAIQTKKIQFYEN